MARPKGLIRYESEENIAHNKKTKFNWRIAAYSFVLILLTSALVVMLVTRDDVDARVLRTAGQMFQTMPDGRISNLYNIKLVNKTRKEIPVTMRLENMKGEITVVQKDMVVPKESHFQTSFFVKIERQLVVKRKTPIVLGVYQGDKKIETINTTFLRDFKISSLKAGVNHNRHKIFYMKLSWGYKIMFVYIAFVAGMGFLVFKASNQKFDLVTKDYYEQELKYQQVIDQAANSSRLSAPVTIERKEGELKISFPDEMKNKKKLVDFYLYYAADAKKDFRKSFELNENELAQALPVGMKGMYELKLSWEVEGVRYYFEKKLFF